MTDFKRVEFKTYDSIVLRGDFFQATGAKRGIVVMAQGLTLLKEHYIEDTARRLQSAGISALVYDHRSYGSSDGQPRHETNPNQQAEDYHDAVTAAMTLPGVDPSRVVIWGIGHSGGAAMIAAADDHRLKAVILNMPFISGAQDAKTFPEGILDRAWRAREAVARSEVAGPSYVEVWPTSSENARGAGPQPFLAGEVPYNFIMGGLERSNAAGTPWENKMTLQSFYHLARVEPRDFVTKIKAPTLYLAAAEDSLTGPLEMHQAVHAQAGKNVEFKVLRPHHLATYFGEAFEAAVAAQLEFLGRVL
jgi:uncharacterized protein